MVVRLTVGDVVSDVLSDDISADGLFLRTDLEVKRFDRVHVEIDLPFGMQLSVPAVVAWRRVANGYAPGIGVRFYPLTELEQEGWDQFVELISAMATPDGDKPAVDLEDKSDPVRRRHPRMFAAFGVRMRRGDATYYGETRDVSAAGLFVLTDIGLAPGERVTVQIERPATEPPLEVECVVRRHVRYPEWSAGLGLEIT